MKQKSILKAFRLPADMLSRIGAAAKKGESFSDFLRAAIQRELTRRAK